MRYASSPDRTKAKELTKPLPGKQLKTHTHRRGTKGGLTRQVACPEVYPWAATNAKHGEVEHLRLITSRNVDGSEVKYGLTNDLSRPGYTRHSEPALPYRQMQRYWVEGGYGTARAPPA